MNNVHIEGNYLEILDNLTEAHNELFKLMDQVIKNPSVRFKNDHLIKCWETKNCRKKIVPLIKKIILAAGRLQGRSVGTGCRAISPRKLVIAGNVKCS